ncbi:TIGR04255 family protein [Bradyrhizobium ottawaense]|uniref:TIGR04255 family protein n=1 Tax=Bradyrhizobium ottawaense TaxID=931866 RepID=A0A2U8PDT4_9BRAD|nr:TIGR04255 family protein [Bradyrhizobium ottawaense]AWL95740.1 TIGR04255 family protein [Bradyrhizobium ottawaense]
MTVAKDRRHYSKAPVVEALIDIQIEQVPAVDLAAVERLTQAVLPEFPTRLPLHHLQMGFQVSPGGDAEFMKDQQTLGYRLDRPGRVLQFRTTGFSYSHLAPYSDWTTFSAEAQGYWDLYLDALAPTRANRCAVRMINRLPLPAGDIRLVNCLNFYPTLPDSLPTNAQSLFMQLQLPMKQVDPDAIAILGLYSAPPAPGPNAIMLDIDFVIQRSIPVGEAFQVLAILGDKKDEIFEACITDEIRKLIA